MPELTNEELTLALAVVAGVALLILILSIFFAFRLRRLRRQYTTLRGDKGDVDILEVVGGSMKKVRTIDQRLNDIAGAQQTIASIGRYALQKFHLVRYDAFEDMGGRLSFSAAILDDHGDGLVITSINGRTETRTYAKPVKGLNSDHNLSEEEREAIAGAAAALGRGAERTPAVG